MESKQTEVEKQTLSLNQTIEVDQVTVFHDQLQ